jgi:putative hydrolase
VTAVAGPERKALIDRLQATMAMVEGHAEHVMDVAGAPVLPNVATLREAMDRRRRDRSPTFKLLERLLGLDLKLRQYEDGRRFCDGVVRRGGIDALNRAWMSPERLPSLAELDDPAAWIRRTEIRAVEPPG